MKLRDLCSKVTSGGTPSRAHPEYYSSDDEGHLWIKSKELLDCAIADSEERISDSGLKNSSAKYLPANTVLIAMYGANVGQLGWLRRPATVNQAICGLVTEPRIADHRYVFYALMDTRAGLVAQAQGAAQQNLNQDKVKEYEIPCPPVADQRRIASILAAYDDLIENNTRRIAILEEMARRIYEEWFVRFRFPGHEGVQMVESEFGPLPEAWRPAAVGDVAAVHRGRSYKGTELAEHGGLPFVNLKCMERDGGFRASGLKRYTGEFKESQTVRPGDIVMAVTDMTQERRIVARAGRVSGIDAAFGVFSMDLVRIATRGEYPELYLYSMLRWSGFPDTVKQHANGANVLHLVPARIEEHRFACPEPALAARFSELVAPMFALCETLSAQTANLRATRDLLLPKLISGDLEVSAMREPEALAA